MIKESKEVIIIGTGGFAAELVEYIYDNNKNSNIQIKIKGYLDINDLNHKHYLLKEPFLGNEDDYEFASNQIVYIAVGNEKIRKNIMSKLIHNKNINFENFIHHSVKIPDSSSIGIGNIMVPNVTIGPKVTIGNFNVINYNCAIAHDCKVGNHNIFSPNVYIAGYCKIGNNNFMSISTSLVPSKKIDNNNKVQAGVVVNQDISNYNIIFSMEKIKYMPIYKTKL